MKFDSVLFFLTIFWLVVTNLDVTAAVIPQTPSLRPLLSKAVKTNKTVRFAVEGMHCKGCVRAIETDVSSIVGVKSCKVNLEKKRAEVTFDPIAVSEQIIIERIKKLGFTARVA